MTRHIALSLAATIAFTPPLFAGDVPFDEAHWETDGDGVSFETYKGKDAIVLTTSSAEVKGAKFKNGIIEVDVAIPEARGFSFVQFRIEDGSNYEEFYLRPHQSGKPDANQYQPVINGHTHWQLYHGPAYSTPTAYSFDEWMHMKLVIKDDRMDVYIDSDEPVLQVAHLLRETKEGRLGIASFQTSRFANFSYTEMDNPPITEMEIEEVSPEEGMITNWRISSEIFAPIDTAPTKLDGRSIAWKQAGVDERGILVFSEEGRLEEGASSIYAKHTFHSDVAGLTPIRFGYSDRVRVYANGDLIYSGDNTYRTRDFRYLGTIGLFDTVFVPAKAGDNEVIFEVSESFGGWALMGKK